MFLKAGKTFELDSLKEKLSSRWSDQASKLILPAAQFAQCLTLNKIPDKQFLTFSTPVYKVLSLLTGGGDTRISSSSSLNNI